MQFVNDGALLALLDASHLAERVDPECEAPFCATRRAPRRLFDASSTASAMPCASKPELRREHKLNPYAHPLKTKLPVGNVFMVWLEAIIE